MINNIYRLIIDKQAGVTLWSTIYAHLLFMAFSGRDVKRIDKALSFARIDMPLMLITLLLYIFIWEQFVALAVGLTL